MTTPEELYTFVESLVNLSTLQEDVERIVMPTYPDDFPDVDDMSTDGKRIFRICKITNRFDPDYDAGKSAGYRDVSIDVEVCAPSKHFCSMFGKKAFANQFFCEVRGSGCIHDVASCSMMKCEWELDGPIAIA